MLYYTYSQASIARKFIFLLKNLLQSKVSAFYVVVACFSSLFYSQLLLTDALKAFLVVQSQYKSPLRFHFLKKVIKSAYLII